MSDTEPAPDHPTAPPTAEPTVAQPTPAPETAAEAATARVEAVRPRLRDHAFGLRSVLAVALAGVVLGGLGGFGLHAATDDDHRDDRFGPGRGFQGGPGGPGGRGGPGGFPQDPGQQGPGQQGPGKQAPQSPPSEAPGQDS